MPVNAHGVWEKQITDDFGDTITVGAEPDDLVYVTFKVKYDENEATMALTPEQLAAFRKALKKAAKRAAG